ncbi:MAG TPA: response regulator [Clostridiales bacterium]|nr:response regulator [Clostridiales bacterium]
MKLLIVDDEPMVRKGLLYGFDWLSIGVEAAGTASNGIEAIEFIKLNQPDVVLADIKMPGMNGLELGKWVKNNYPYIDVIFLTAYGDFDYARQAIELEAANYLLKPVDADVLFSTMEKIKKKTYDEKKRKIVYKTDKEKLKSIIVNHNMEALNEYLHEYFNLYRKHLNIKLDNKELIIFELISAVYEVIREHEKNGSELALDSVTLEEFAKLQTFEELQKEITRFLIECVDNALNKNNECYKHDIDKIIKYTRNCYMKDINLKTVSSTFSINPSYLSRVFSESTGVSFTNYLNELRMLNAKELLKNTDFSVKTVSKRVGYNNEKYFIRIFKKVEGITPQEYRTSNKINKSN